MCKQPGLNGNPLVKVFVAEVHLRPVWSRPNANNELVGFVMYRVLRGVRGCCWVEARPTAMQELCANGYGLPEARTISIYENV